MDGLQFVEGREYTVTARIRGSKPGDLNVQLGDWGALQEKECRLPTNGLKCQSKCHPSQQPADSPYSSRAHMTALSKSIGSDSLTAKPTSPKPKFLSETFDFSDDHKLGGWGSDITYDVIDGVFVINNSTAAKDWEKQACYETGNSA